MEMKQALQSPMLCPQPLTLERQKERRKNIYLTSSSSSWLLDCVREGEETLAHGKIILVQVVDNRRDVAERAIVNDEEDKHDG